MPCRSEYMEPTPGEKKATKELREEFEALGNEATYSADMLREYLLGNLSERDILKHVNLPLHDEHMKHRRKNEKLYVKVQDNITCKVNELIGEYEELNLFACRMEPPTKKQLQTIERAQIKHREADLRRLMKELGARGEREKLLKVLQADSKFPLEPQLGFSPDKF